MKIFDKVRFGLRIPQIQNQLKENKNLLQELNWANVFNNTISNSDWFIKQSISPGRSALGYPLLYVTYRILDDIQPANILEFGLGQSSKMLIQFAKWKTHNQVTTIEHDENWINLWMKNQNLPVNYHIKQHNLNKIDIEGNVSLSLKNIKHTSKENKYDLIIVDGPFGSKRFSRPQILELIPENIDKNNFCILMDDYDRVGEKETCSQMEVLFKENNIEYKKAIYGGIKKSIIYCSNNLWFLTTL